MMRCMPKEEGPRELCKRCGKTPCADATAYCRDCADTLTLRGLLVPLPGQHTGEAPAETGTETTPDDEAP
jgi:hypothetical protein